MSSFFVIKIYYILESIERRNVNVYKKIKTGEFYRHI